MRIAHAHATEWGPIRRVRGGSLRFKHMLEGSENSPNNYSLVIAEQGADFQSPRHHHNFDQLRMSLAGATNIAPKRNIEQGDIAYFPEGVYYGPQNQEEAGAGSIALVVQFGGPSGNGIMSRRQMDEGFARLREHGEFEAGVYRRHAGEPGRRNQDAYEAIWEFHSDRPLRYPKPRFQDPLFFRVQNFGWLPVPGHDGVSAKEIGDFTERHVGLSMLRLEAGASYTLPASDQLCVVFMSSGSGTLESAGPWAEHSVIELLPGESPAMKAQAPTEGVLLRFPRF